MNAGWRRSSDCNLYRHGGCVNHQETPEYRSWRKMRRRCMDPKVVGYKNYGGRGIQICERWNDFSAFLTDMGPKPTPTHSIDRINNNGDYEPANCRWATRSQQRRNKRQKFLSDDQISDIRAMSDRGSTRADIARHFEVTWKTVHIHLNGASPSRQHGNRG